MRVRRWLLLVLVAVVACAFPLLVVSSWRPEGDNTGGNVESLRDDPSNAVFWLAIASPWLVVLVLLVMDVRHQGQDRRSDAEVWEDEW